jgi:hypothetical protein
MHDPPAGFVDVNLPVARNRRLPLDHSFMLGNHQGLGFHVLPLTGQARTEQAYDPIVAVSTSGAADRVTSPDGIGRSAGRSLMADL